jgi:hypothetical protein
VRRWILTILLFLLLGAVVNVAVAWGVRVIGWWGTSTDVYERAEEWPCDVPDDWPPPASFRRSTMIGKTYDTWLCAPQGGYSWESYIVVECRYGLPWRSAAFLYLREHDATGEVSERRWSCSLDGSLPLLPVWPGFLINTALYAAILWLLIPGPLVLRRLIRRRRGRCPKCGYDLRGQRPEVGAAPGKGCPECAWNRQPEATT